MRPTSPVPWELGEGNFPRLPDTPPQACGPADAGGRAGAQFQVPVPFSLRRAGSGSGNSLGKLAQGAIKEVRTFKAAGHLQ